MNVEILFKIVMTILGVIVFIFFLRGVWKGQIDIKETFSGLIRKTIDAPDFIVKRDPNKIYQSGKVVGIVSGSVQEQNGSIIFQELYETEELNQGLSFYYQRYTLRIKSIQSVIGQQITTSNKGSKIKKAVLLNVVCEKIK